MVVFACWPKTIEFSWRFLIGRYCSIKFGSLQKPAQSSVTLEIRVNFDVIVATTPAKGRWNTCAKSCYLTDCFLVFGCKTLASPLPQ